MKRTKLMTLFVILTGVLLLSGCANNTQHKIATAGDELFEPQYIKAKILEIKELIPENPEEGTPYETQIISVQIIGGEFDGQKLNIEHITNDFTPFSIHVEPQDEVVLMAEVEEGQLVNAYIESHARDKQLKALLFVFTGVLILLGKLKGLKSVITLGFTVIAILNVLLPLILQGYNPIILGVLVSAIVTTFTLILVSGANRKTLSAIIGTTGGVIIAGLIAVKVGTAAKLTGFSSEESVMLMFIPQETTFDFRGLLFAGIIIGALGAVMDVSMSIASAMDEIKQVSPNISRQSLIQSGMNVGRDLMGTMSNTLILAYTSGSLPLLLLFSAYKTPLIRIVSLELIATEIIRALAGSLGLIMAIPISAIASGYILSSGKGKRNSTAPRHSRSRSSRNEEQIQTGCRP